MQLLPQFILSLPQTNPSALPLKERFIQNAVAERLNKEYYRRDPAHVATEEYTRLKRADVFIAFMRTKISPYVVVVEAKSRTTIHQLKLKDNRNKVLWTGRVIALALIVGLSAALGYQWYFNALNTLLLIGLFLLGTTVISALISKLEFSFLQSISAIKQLGNYPANESWIAVGDDTFVRPREYRILKTQCKKNGVGLIVVNQKGRLSLKVYPKPRQVFNDYLGSYGKKKQILATIEKNPDTGPTPAERAQRRRQLFNAAAMVGITVLLCTLAYEENYGPVVPDPFQSTLLDASFDDSVGASAGAEVGDDPMDLPTDPFALDGIAADDCSNISVERRSFIVADAVLPLAEGQRRLAELDAIGVTGIKMIAADCLNSWPASGRYVLYTGELYPNRPAAKRAARAYRELLDGMQRPAPYGQAIKLYPQSVASGE